MRRYDHSPEPCVMVCGQCMVWGYGLMMLTHVCLWVCLWVRWGCGLTGHACGSTQRLLDSLVQHCKV